MTEFVESPIFENWFQKHVPQESLLICTPYMKQGALNRLFELYSIEAQSPQLDLRVLIRGNVEEFTVGRSSDISILNTFLDLPGFDPSHFRRITNLHMKAYLIDGRQLLITSGNLTNSGMFAISMSENFEGGIATDDPDIIRQFQTYFQHIWKQSEGLDAFYGEIMDAYASYAAAARTSGGEPRRRKKYVFSASSSTPAAAAPVSRMFVPSDLPPARIETLPDTLTTLARHAAPMTMPALGRALREQLGMSNPDSAVNNQKYGEEKGNLAVYFGLAHRKQAGVYEYSISAMGQNYLTWPPSRQRAYLMEQMQTKEALCDILERRQEPGFTLKTYLDAHCVGSPSTLSRKLSPIQSLLDLYDRETAGSL